MIQMLMSVSIVFTVEQKKNGGSISRREVYKNKIGGCKTPESVQKIFEEMEKRKLGTIETRTPSNGGRKTILFIISNSHS